MTDYEEQFSAFNRISDSVLNASRRSTCYNQSIYDDVQIELSEYAGLTLDVRDANTVTRVTERYSNAAILILDDDGKEHCGQAYRCSITHTVDKITYIMTKLALHWVPI